MIGSVRVMMKLLLVLTMVLAWSSVRARPDADNDHDPSASLQSPTLAAVRRHGEIRIAYRSYGHPFSFRRRDGRVVGYSIDLCEEVVARIRAMTGLPSLNIRFEDVPHAEVIPAIESGRIDMDCATLSITPEREALVGFSHGIYLTGTRILVRRDSGIRTLDDLKGRSIAVGRDTVNEARLNAALRENVVVASVVLQPGADRSFESLAEGEVDAMATDGVLLTSMLARSGHRNQYSVLDDALGSDEYGIAFRHGDTVMADIVDSALRELARLRTLSWLHDRWFVRETGIGSRLALRMSSAQRQLYRDLGMPD